MHSSESAQTELLHGFSAIVLAGGRSSRMGQDKALLEFEGVSMLQRTVQLAQQLGCQQILISRNSERCIADQLPQRGPLGGIQACMDQLKHPYCLMLPVDMPLLQADDLKPLLRASAASFKDFPLPCMIPVTPFLRQYLHQALQSPLQKGQALSVAALLKALSAKTLPLAESTRFINTNTQAEWYAVTGQQHLELHQQDGCYV